MIQLVKHICDIVNPVDYYKVVFPDANWDQGPDEVRVLSPFIHETEPSFSINRKNGKWRRKEVTDNKVYYPNLFFASDGVPYVTYNANHKVKIAWADDVRGEDWTEKTLAVDYHGKNYYGYFDDDDAFHSTFAAVRDPDDTRLGFREYWKKSGQWQKKLRNSGKTYSTLASIIPAINSLDNVYIVATQKSGKEYKIVYNWLK